jgi:hypothetical protein
VKFVYEQLECTVPEDVFMVHLDPVPTDRVNLGQIVCTAAGSSVTPVFEITSKHDALQQLNKNTVVQLHQKNLS